MKKQMIRLHEDNSTIIVSKISDLKIKEEYVYKISKEKYSNDEPCIIIRSKIANKIYCELSEYIENSVKKGKRHIGLDELPEIFVESIMWGTNTQSLSIGSDIDDLFR